MKRLLNKHRAGLPPVGREVQIRDVQNGQPLSRRERAGVQFSALERKPPRLDEYRVQQKERSQDGCAG